MQLDFKLNIFFLKEGKRFIAQSPALDLSTSGKSLEEARNRFGEAATIFFEEITQKGTVDAVLGDLGWTKQKKSWLPPLVVSKNIETISIPAGSMRSAIPA